ncbi:MAG: ABC transporter ATP-binding protein [Tissierellia bacterium]|nr:ABC transporter ATP-binding protein [Tissierellia bacterium]
MKYEVKNIVKQYGKLQVLDKVSIQFEENKIICILGPSGCGKTTLLNIMVGTLSKDYGEVIGFEKEDISFVFQEDRLIEWKNVKDNVGFVLRDKMDKKVRENVIDKYLRLVNLEEYKYYYPRQLSGGMRQRISILRAFAYPSKILIMDEPFKSLDINSKRTIMEFTLKLKELRGKTCILVTHDIQEALTLGDKIVILTEKPTKVKKVIENIPISDRSKESNTKLKELIENQLII